MRKDFICISICVALIFGSVFDGIAVFAAGEGSYAENENHSGFSDDFVIDPSCIKGDSDEHCNLCVDYGHKDSENYYKKQSDIYDYNYNSTKITDPNMYRIVYRSEKAGMLTENGGWISPPYYDTDDGTVVYDYFWDSDRTLDRIRYIKERLHVDDLKDANLDDVDYLISFILPYSSDKCNYTIYYLNHVYGDVEATITEGSVWKCPLCNEGIRIDTVDDYGPKVTKNGKQIFLGSYIQSHLNGCALKDEDRYWNCDLCGQTYELGSSPFLGRFKNYDEAGRLSIDSHMEWCADRTNCCYHCPYCNKDLIYLNRNGEWDREWVIDEKDGNSTSYITVGLHTRNCQVPQAAKKIVSETISYDMNELEKAWYLYKWMLKNVTYDYRDAGYGNYFCSESEYSTKYSDQPAIGTEEFKKDFFVLNDRVYKRCEYTEKEIEIIKKDGEIFHQEAYGSLIQTDAVCSGKSRGYVWLLHEVGIDAYYKHSNKRNHAWTTVKLNGKWYNVDPTNGCFMRSDANIGADKLDDIKYGYMHRLTNNDNIEEDLRCTDTSYDSYTTIAQIYEAMYGKTKPERPQDSEYDKKGINTNSVSVDMVIKSGSAFMIVGDKASLQISRYETTELYIKGKSASLSNGVIYANKKGSCKVLTGSGKNKKTICKIKIEEPKPKTTVKLKVGKTKKAKLKGTKQAVKYTISDNKIATVDGNGRVTGVKSGKTIMTAIIGKHMYTTNVIVK